MFKCIAGHISKPGTPMFKLITKVRKVVYMNSKQEVIGHGSEIEEEKPVCSDCHKLMSVSVN